MVLNFGGMQTLFPQSTADGAGMVPDIIIKRILDGDSGPSLLTLLHSGEGVSTATVEEQLDTITFSKGTFTTTDTIYLLIISEDESGGGAGVLQLKVAGTNSGTANLNLIQSKVNTFEGELFQDFRSNDIIKMILLKLQHDAAPTYISAGFDLDDTDVMTTAFTISLRGNANTSGNIHWKWRIYKRGRIELQ